MKIPNNLYFCYKHFLLTSLYLFFGFNCCFSQSINLESDLNRPSTDTASAFSPNASPVVKVTYAEEFSGYGTGGGFVTAKKGYKFLGVYINVLNKAAAPLDINLNEFYLPDTLNRVIYRVHSVMGTGPFTVFKKPEYTLKPGKDLNRKLVYIIPKDFNAQFLFYRKALVQLGEIQR